MAARQAPPSLGFSRQEHWSGLPFPSPMHESEKRKRSRSVVSDSQRPHGLQPTRLLQPWDSPGKSTGVGCHCLLRHITWPPFNFYALFIFVHRVPFFYNILEESPSPFIVRGPRSFWSSLHPTCVRKKTDIYYLLKEWIKCYLPCEAFSHVLGWNLFFYCLPKTFRSDHYSIISYQIVIIL